MTSQCVVVFVGLPDGGVLNFMDRFMETFQVTTNSTGASEPHEYIGDPLVE